MLTFAAILMFQIYSNNSLAYLCTMKYNETVEDKFVCSLTLGQVGVVKWYDIL